MNRKVGEYKNNIQSALMKINRVKVKSLSYISQNIASATERPPPLKRVVHI